MWKKCIFGFFFLNIIRWICEDFGFFFQINMRIYRRMLYFSSLCLHPTSFECCASQIKRTQLCRMSQCCKMAATLTDLHMTFWPLKLRGKMVCYEENKNAICAIAKCKFRYFLESKVLPTECYELGLFSKQFKIKLK